MVCPHILHRVVENPVEIVYNFSFQLITGLRYVNCTPSESHLSRPRRTFFARSHGASVCEKTGAFLLEIPHFPLDSGGSLC